MNHPKSIAIIGAACRLPGAETLLAFADLLLMGRSAITQVPEDRWTKSRYLHPLQGLPGKTYSFAAGALADVFAFDAAFFGISPREAPSIDPHQRLMLELANEAIEDAGLLPSRLAGSNTGVFVGASSWDFAAVSFADVAALDAYGMQGAALSSVSNRISYVFGLRGPSLTVDTACSSSLVALHLACEAVRRGEIEQAVVGGVNLLLAPQSYVGFARASMLSRLGQCHSFDARADGYVRGEGGGALIVKDLESALANGDPIRAVIRASGINSDGRTNGFSMPSGTAQAALLRQVAARAGVTPDEFSYFEAHGTGTPVGDPIEAAAIGEAIGQNRRTPLPIGSVKSNIGHLESASGMAGLMKLLVAFKHGVIPPSLNFETPNPNIPFVALNLQVVAKSRPLAPPGVLALAGINSFGFGGTNAHAVLAAPPAPAPAPKTPEPASGRVAMPLLLSARSSDALRALAASWRDALKETNQADVPALLRGSARHRDQYPHRMVVTGRNAAALADQLEAWLGNQPAPGVAAGQTNGGGLAFVYTGNGSQWAGMGRDALRTNASFRAAFADLDEQLAPGLGWSVTARLASDDLAATLRHAAVAQPLLFAIQVATVSALRSRGLRPNAHVGHSAGEVAAACSSGALSLQQASHVITQRSLLQDATHGLGGMATLAIGRTAAEALIARIDPLLAVAAVNGASTVTIGGPVGAIELLEDAARDLRVHCCRLDLDYAFHSPLMEPIRLPLLAALDGLSSAEPMESLISTVTGEKVGTGELNAEYWWRNVRQPVRFADAIDRLIRDGVRTFLEVGPAPMLQHYLRDALNRAGEPGRVLATLSRRPVTIDPFAAAVAECHVAGADITTAACFDGVALVRGLPPYPYQRQHYAAGRTVEAVEVTSPAADHRLLGFRDPASRDAWMSHLSTATEPWLADHVVHGAAILPAAAIIEMALATARVRHPEAELLEIQDLEITRSLVLEPDAVRDCRTTVTPDGHWQLASRPRLSQEPTQPHATCRILPGLGSHPILAVVPPGSAPPGSHPPGSHDVIEAAAVYARARTLHLEYGPAFQTVVRVHRLSATQGVADLTPGDPDRLAEGYLLDPAVVDGSLQALLALVVGDPRVAAMGAVVPWRFGRVRLLRQGIAQPAQASLHIRHIGSRSICADIALTDCLGETVAELLDCWFVAMPFAAGAASDHGFWTAYIPSLRQPTASLPDLSNRVIAAAGGVEDVPEGVWLADACVTAIAFEALLGLSHDDRLPAAVTDRPLAAVVLPWLAEDRLATREPGGWRLTTGNDLPAAGEIWRSLMFGAGECAAECAMLAALGPSLATGDASALNLSPVLRDQALFSSPSAREAMAALLRGLDAITTTWPAGRCLRIALVGALNATLLGRVLARIEARGIPLRLVALAASPDVLPSIQDVLSHTPGAAAQLWFSLPDDDWYSFDVVLDLYGLSLPSRDRLTPDQILRLLAPTGVLLAAEPVRSRPAELLFGPGIESGATAALYDPDSWCVALCDAGFATARHTLLDGTIWSASLLVASAPGQSVQAAGGETHGEQADLVVFAAANDALAAALAARLSLLHLLPIEAMREVLTAPFAAQQQHVLLLASDEAEDDAFAETLAELLADISTALQSMATPQTARLWLVSPGSPSACLVSAALTGLRRVAANEMPLLDCRVISLDVALPDAEAACRILQELAEPDQESEVFWRLGNRLVPRLRSGLPRAPVVSGPRRLEVTRPGLINSLVWVAASPAEPGPNEVAIEVHAAGLNFRDVMWAQGMLPDEALMQGFSGPSLGLECAGIVTAVGEGVTDLRPGDRVAAVAPASLATHVVTRRNGVMRMSSEISFAAAATIPVAFMTAVYALGHLARLEPGETVLIHGGAGGVGLAAIQYALHKGAVVYATAGSEMRRQTLRMLGVAAVFDSRGTSFVDDILAVTDRKGVDVVLNSVSQELMKQSLRLLRPFGRFLEIGKRDLYGDTPIGIRPLRHNASYYAIDIDELVAHRPEVGLSLLKETADLLAAGDLSPLPYRAYGFGDAVAAFRLLQSSGHVGKVVLLPEPTRCAAKPAPFRLRTDGTYVVTGGLT
ncbi:MAG: beta-ketoacyl synthase N-terminal-like domain-containing protein, partial [Rhodopila sp.]